MAFSNPKSKCDILRCLVSIITALIIGITTPPPELTPIVSEAYASSDEDEDEENGDNGGENGNGDSGRAVPSESRSTGEQDGEDDEETKVFTDNPPDDPLYIASYSMDEQDLLNTETLNIDGEIKNNDTDAANFVKITATFYDANNKTLGSEMAFTDPTTLDPGQSAPFKMSAGVLGNLNIDEIRYIKFHLSSQ